MVFDDGFKFNKQQIEDIVLRAFMRYIKRQFKKTGDGSVVMVASSKLIEAALSTLGITSFDFVSDNTRVEIEDALVNTLQFLTSKSILTSYINDNSKFYKYFIRRELFKSREFSNSFEENLILNLIYKLDFSLHYLVTADFQNFYDVLVAHSAVVHANKIIKINIAHVPEQRILVLPVNVNEAHLRQALLDEDYTLVANYIANPNKLKHHITLVPTSDNYDLNLWVRLTSICNMDKVVNAEIWEEVK